MRERDKKFYKSEQKRIKYAIFIKNVNNRKFDFIRKT